MQKITNKERIELEEVFSAICIKKEPKYKIFYKKLIQQLQNNKKTKLVKG